MMEGMVDNTHYTLVDLLLIFFALYISFIIVRALLEFLKELIMKLLDKILVLLMTPVFWILLQVARPFGWLFVQIATPLIVLYVWWRKKLFELEMKLFWRKKPKGKRQEKQQPHEKHTHKKSHTRQESQNHRAKRGNTSQATSNKNTTGDIRVDKALALLGLPIDKSFGMKELNVQFREMVKDCHPDRGDIGDVELMQEINKARDVIKTWRAW